MSFVDKLRKNKKSLFEQQTNESKAFVTKLQENKQKSLLNIKQDTSISNDNNQIEIDQKKKELQQAIKLEKEKRDLYLNQKNKESLKPQNILEANRKTTKIDEIRENAKNLQTYDDSELNKLNREYAELNGYESDKFVKSIGKTALNIPLKLADGALKSAESILIDAPLTLALNASEFIDGLDGSKDENRSNRLKELIATDLVDEGMKSLGWDDELYNKVENNSLVKRNNLGGAVVEGIGGMLPSMIGGGASKALGYGIRGLSAFGGGTEEAFQNNASTGDAIKYGLGNSVTEIATEWLTGGIPGVKGTSMGGLDKLVAKKLGQKSLDEISSSLAKEIIKYGYKIAGEGAEEALAEIINPILKNMTYSQDEKIDWNNVIESAIVGGLTSGILNAPEFKNNINTMNQTQKIPVNSIREDVNIYNLGENTAEDASKALKNKYNYLETDNSKINELRKSASKYFADSIETQNMINTYEKIIGDKNYNVIFDDTITNKDGNNVNAQIKTLNNGEIEIRINPNANRSGEFLIMHEVTHAIETDRMKKLVMDYANKHSDFKDALESLKRTYNTNDISSEVLADISGQLFGNQEFINNLSMEQPNIFKKIYNKIVELANRLTGNSHEALFIRDLKNKWEEAYRITDKNQSISNLENNPTFSIQTDINGNKYVNIDTDQDIFNGKSLSEQTKIAKQYILNHFRNDGININNDTINVTSKTANEYTHPRNQLPKNTKESKMRASTELDNLLNVSQYKYSRDDDGRHPFAKDGWDYYETMFKVGDNTFSGLVNIGKSGNKKTLYDITNIKRISQNRSTSANAFTTSLANPDNNNISQSDTNVKSNTLSTKYSTRSSKNNNLWESFLNENFRANGTRTNMQNIRFLEEANSYTSNKQGAKRDVSNEPIIQYNKPRVEDPLQISRLTIDDASTTPILKNYNKQDSKKGDKQSKFYENVTETSKMLDEDVRDMLKKEDDVKFYKSVTNEESLNRASTRLKEGGRAETDRWLSQEPEKADATDVAEGWILLKQYGDKIKEAKQSGNIAMADEYNHSLTQVAKKMGEMGTKAGQAIQAYNIMSRMTPEGMVYYAQDALNDAYSSLVKNKSKKWIERNQNKFTLTPEETTYIMQEMEAISKMKEGRGKKIRLGKIQTMIQNKIPSSFGDKTKTWMRISMLFNPKTQVRNITGNAVMVPMNAIADTFSAIMDKQISKSTGIRTVGLPNAKSMLQGAKKGLFDSYSDFKNDVNTRNMQGNRFEIKSGKAFDDNSSVGHVLNRIDKMLSFALDAGDRPFYESAFTNSINNQMILNNVDKPTAEMVEIATSEALQRTWQDNNKYTKLVLDIRKALNTVSLPENLPVLKRFSGYGLGDILIPFAKTPANLTKAIVDYSPVGLGKTLLTDAINLKNSLKNGQYSATLQHRFVQNLGKGMAGSLLYILGYALAKAGIVTGENDDDKDVANFMKNNLGIQPYSIKIGDHTFTYDWAQPLAAPLAIGANIVQKQEEGKEIMDGIAISLNEGFNVILEQSFLQSINDVFSDAGKVPEKIFQEILEIPSRAVPTLFKQINDLIDPTVRTTFEYDNPVGSAINSVKNKIPGLSQTLSPQIDTMGREIKRYGGDNNIFNVFLNPANTNKGEMSDSAKEIYKVYQETGDKTILPRTAPYYIDQKGNRITFTAEQKAEFQSIAGQIIEDNVKKLNNNQNYKQLDFNEKAESIKGIVDYAYNYAREKVAGISMSNSYNKVKEWLTQGKQLSDYYANKDENNYSLQSPEKHFSISNFKIDYDKYTDYRKKVSSLKKKFPGKENTTIRKNEVYKYINSLPLNQYQKILLWKELGGYSISGYKNMMYKYINNLKISKKEKEIIWEELYGE